MFGSITKVVIFLACCSMAFSAVAQTADTVRASVEKSTWGMQVGAIGGWVYHELRLDDPVVLRIELGMVGQLRSPTFGVSQLVWTPVVRVSPRWYYSLANRMRQSKDIAGNSGNFVSLPMTYTFGWSSYYDNSARTIRRLDAISIIPSWGIRRNITRRFTFELGAGLGLLILVSPPGSGSDRYLPFTLWPDGRFRIGYRFLGNASKKKNRY